VYLLDTNIFLEILVDREHAPVIRDLLTRKPAIPFFISDFSVYSIGIFLTRRKLYTHFSSFIDDLFRRDIRIQSLANDELKQIPRWCEQYGMDFDDACQYGIAETYQLRIVSLDRDFDSVPSGRIHPKDL